MSHPLSELAGLFLKLGAIGFGGPAVHIATMEDEVVVRRKWMTHEHFLDLVGATNLIPGPNSTEMAIHIGYHRAGLAGLIIAGLCFVLPAWLLTTAAAWAYQTYGELPNVQPMLQGIKPAVLAIIFAAGYRLGKKAFRTGDLLLIGVVVAVASLLGANEIWLLLAGGACGAILRRNLQAASERDKRNERIKKSSRDKHKRKLGLLFALTAAPQNTVQAAGPFSNMVVLAAVAGAALPLWKLGLFFLKVGSILYGGGYVLIAYLRGGIEPGGVLHGIISETELIDAIAVGQFTPGPILSTSAFIGFLADGVPGAAVASLGIFLPSFLFVAILNPIVPRLRKSAWAGAFLDAVSAASIGLLISAALWLTARTLVDTTTGAVAWPGVFICGVSWVLFQRWKVPAAVIVVFGAVAGLLLARFGFA